MPAKAPRHKQRPSHPRDMESDMDLLSDLLKVGKVSSRTDVNVVNSTARVSEDAILLEVNDEGYGKPTADAEELLRTEDDVNVSLGEKKKKQSSKKSKSLRDEGVTLTGMSVSGTSPPRKKQKASGSSAGPPVTLGALASTLPQIRKTPIRQILDEYGCADEKFVRSMVGDLKGIELDQIRVGSNTPQQNRRYAREASMKALFAVYAIDASEDTNEMKERVPSLNDQISYLGVEKKTTEKDLEAERKEKLSLAEKFAKLSLHTKELEGKAERVLVLECDVDALQRENAKLPSKLKEKDDQIADLQGQMPAQGELAVGKFKELDELKAMLKAAREGGIIEKFDVWSRLGYLDKAKMKDDS
uniref:uncharacterized protein LOC105351477 n=1 Tax=Fragaria vesca subsp. vesca TaxID=101020 RepID=UPI0005CB7683|nr:PREDICTED: uncharacterized protein LOC105351477 [Fragaria vesca subsp. vesca]